MEIIGDTIIMKTEKIDKLYTVRACRWGDPETHSYIVGVYTTLSKATVASEVERNHRGGKYECEILEWTPDEGTEHQVYHPNVVYLPWDN